MRASRGMKDREWWDRHERVVSFLKKSVQRDIDGGRGGAREYVRCIGHQVRMLCRTR